MSDYLCAQCLRRVTEDHLVRGLCPHCGCDPLENHLTINELPPPPA